MTTIDWSEIKNVEIKIAPYRDKVRIFITLHFGRGPLGLRISIEVKTGNQT